MIDVEAATRPSAPASAQVGLTGQASPRRWPRVEQISASEDSVRRVLERRDGSTTISTVGALFPSIEEQPDPAALADTVMLRRQRLPSIGAGTDVLRFADLFSGCGSLSLGVIEAATALGLRPECSLAVDLDANAIAVYRASLGAERARVADLAKLVDGKLKSRRTRSEKALTEEIQRPDVVVAGPPCQGHSALNNHSRHDDERNDLYLRVARFAAITEPRLVLIENVASVTHDRRRSAELARAELERLGYSTDEGQVDLHRLGVPQLRRRHVLLATRDLPELAVEPVVAEYAVDDPAARTVGWAIADLEGAQASEFDRPSRASAENVKRMRWLHRHDKHDLPNKMRPPCHRDDDHTYKSMYGRLWWDRPAQTITSGFGSMGQGRYVHPRERRTLTPHEAARLQLIPDSFDFSAVTSRGAWAQMIGNAAPMKLSYAFVVEAFR